MLVDGIVLDFDSGILPLVVFSELMLLLELSPPPPPPPPPLFLLLLIICCIRGCGGNGGAGVIIAILVLSRWKKMDVNIQSTVTQMGPLGCSRQKYLTSSLHYL